MYGMLVNNDRPTNEIKLVYLCTIYTNVNGKSTVSGGEKKELELARGRSQLYTLF